MPAKEPIRVLLADDHAVVRKGIREFLEEDGDIIVVAEAADGPQAAALAAQVKPDVAVLDIQMPGMSGIEVTRHIKSTLAGIRVLILTAYNDEPYIVALLQAGADGYMLKTAGSNELIRAVRAVHRGEVILDSEVTRHVVERVAARRAPPAPASVEPLTERELDVLRLAARGLTNKSIGHQLGISDRTVQGHLASIYGKLNVGSRTEAVTQALKLGWIVVE